MMTETFERLKAALVDRYTVEREVGRGGMATVFVATDVRHKRQVAIKVLHPDLAASVGHERFLREIEILASLNHPNILGLIDSGEADGLLYYVMPFVEGESLRQRLKSESQLPIDDAVQITREVADALSYAHGLDIVHRDIKPENIMILAGHAVVTDFGIARAVTEAGGDALTQTGLSVGTPFYMSPEQGTGSENIDARSDLYSLGCVLYEMIGGEPPYTGPNPQAILSRHSQAEIPSVSIIRAQTPPHVEGVIEKALAKSPADRFRTADDMRKALSGEVATSSVKRRSASSRDWRRIGLAAAGVAILAAVAYGVVQFRTAGNAETTDVVRGSILILPFAERGDFDAANDGRRLATYLRNMFSSTDLYHPIPAAVVYEQMARYCDLPERTCGLRVASELGTEFFIWAELYDIGRDSIEIQLKLVDVIEGRDFSPVSARDTRTEAYPLVEHLAQELWALAAQDDPDRMVSIASTTTDDPDALFHFMDGEGFLAEFNTDAALRSYQQATEIDSSFALAWYRRAVIEDWNETPQFALPSALRAESLSEQLSPRDQRALDAHLALISGDPATAERIYKELISADENDFEALMQLGYLYYAHNPRRGRSMAEAIDPLHRAAALAAHPLVDVYLPYALAVSPEPHERRFTEMDSLARIGDNPLGIQKMKALWSIKRGDSLGVAQALDSIGGFDLFGSVLETPRMILLGTIHGDVPDMGVLADRLTALTDSAYLDSVIPPGRRHEYRVWNWRVWGLRIGANREAGRARWTEVRSLLHEMDSLGDSLAPMPATATMGLLATLPLADPVPVDLDSMRAELDRWVAHDRLTWGNSYNVTAWENRLQIRPYLLGLFSAIEGDYEAALEYADEVQRQVAPNDFEPTISQDLAEGVRAEVYLRQGRPDEALAALERAPRHVHYSEAKKSVFLEGAREVFLRGRVLQELGRYDEAIDLYAFVTESYLGAALIAPSHYYRGQIFEAQTDTAQAIWHYEAFTELWTDADPEYQPKVREVLAHVAELKGETLDVSTGGGG
jgi:tetratricopeptide (TPR) repeat protein/tRNA A-37 threonylcarbamoyl transferase component Bud32